MAVFEQFVREENVISDVVGQKLAHSLLGAAKDLFVKFHSLFEYFVEIFIKLLHVSLRLWGQLFVAELLLDFTATAL